MANFRGGSNQAGPKNIRHGLDVIPILIRNGGILFNTHGLRSIGRMSDVQSISNPAAEFLNERDHFESGKKLFKMNDGTNWSGTITFEGDHTSDVATMNAQDLHLAPVIRYGKDLGKGCDLILVSIDDAEDVKIQDFYLDVGIKLGQLPGTENAEINYEVEFYGLEDSQVGRITGGHSLAYEIFYNNGTTWVDPNGPNGNATFTLGHSLQSYDTLAAPSIVQANPDGATDLQKYFFKIRVNGQDQNDSQVSFNPTTKVLTFGGNLAQGDKLEVWYIVDEAGVGPLGIPPYLSTLQSFLTDWKVYQTT